MQMPLVLLLCRGFEAVVSGVLVPLSGDYLSLELGSVFVDTIMGKDFVFNSAVKKRGQSEWRKCCNGTQVGHINF